MTTHPTEQAAEPDDEAPVLPDGAELPPERPGRWHWMLIPLALYTATRFVQLVLIDWMVPPGSRVRDRLLLWDAVWFVRVARDGYPTSYVHTDQEVTAG